MAINWAPWFDVPLHRRLEVFSVGFIVFCEIALGPIATCAILLLTYYGNIYIRAICLLYVTFIYFDRNTADRGGRGYGYSLWRNFFTWKYILDYFPIDLVKTVDLPPDRNYLFCVFPHGWLSLGAGANFSSGHSKWSQLYPGIRPKCTTLGFTMLYPIQREILLNSGFSSASANALTKLLQQSNDPNDAANCDGFTSNGVALIVGGVREAFYTLPNAYKCYLKKRKGFVRIAMQTGATLVPVISYGENDMYEVVEYKSESWIKIFQDTFKRYTNVTPRHFNGRGYLQYTFGLLPRRYPITTVIGAPIHLKKTPNPSYADVNSVHELFCKRLNDLFETHKSKYINNYEHVHLEII